GDLLILTKPIGTGIVVEGVRGGKISEADVRPVFERMAVLNKAAAETMNRFDDVHAATDITGFGLGGHGWEMASGSRVGLRFEFTCVPRWPVAEDLVARGIRSGVRLSDEQETQPKLVFDPSLTPEQQMFLLDPQTSGGLLIAVAADSAETLCAQLVDAGIADAAICGEVFATERPHLEIRP
ncbi:MAG TPA: selenide, water dikinase SelD, partial [Acidobacteriota bacterium]|nr:selenide, water dikinase SelD [Acidobacteriota bacterium]